jgi:hypothetical protein
MARSVICDTSAFQAHIVGELVDALLLDHGGVHVGEEQALAPALGGQDGDIDGQPGEARAQLRLERLGGRGLAVDQHLRRDLAMEHPRRVVRAQDATRLGQHVVLDGRPGRA